MVISCWFDRKRAKTAPISFIGFKPTKVMIQWDIAGDLMDTDQ